MFDTPTRYIFEDFITDTGRARSGDELFGLLRKGVGQYGYDRLVFTVRRDVDLPESLNGHALLYSYPEDWVKYYIENNCASFDPVMKAGATQANAFTWDGLEKRSVYTPKQTRFMRLADEAGLKNGVGVPIRGSGSTIAGVGLASTERCDAAHPHLDMLSAFCTQFYAAFKRLNPRTASEQTEPAHLSPREREVLTWMASGKTDDEIGMILSISRNTVDSHVRHIFLKLNACNRVTAVVAGLMHGHIHL
ncbi:HTH-type quorum sensing-dependent transcriptional regulator RpaR [Asticcacaulis sp. MM231]|uniref:helix-turn-helix transcriptional regulator n=1 Tax=Asticcacaulis sp. MM231 TaxID=3157666 RepID=UPI0032D59948